MMFKAGITCPNTNAFWYCTSITEPNGDKHDFSKDYRKAISLTERQLTRFVNYHESVGYKVTQWINLSDS